MSTRRRRLAFMLGSMVVVGLGLTTLLARRPARGGKDYVLASTPVFWSRTNASSAQTVLWFVVSNKGPVSVRFWLAWSECRAGIDSNIVATKLATGSKSIFLGSGTATNVLMETVGDLRDAKPMVCCEVMWAENESDLRQFGRQLEKPIYRLGGLLGFNWDPPWRRKVFASGDVFTSNLEVSEYFRRTYGLTRELWAEEQRPEQKRNAELARINKSLPPNQMIGYFSRSTKSPTEREQVEMQAKEAFARFCVVSTGDLATAELGGAANQSQQRASGTNRTSDAAGSGR